MKPFVWIVLFALFLSSAGAFGVPARAAGAGEVQLAQQGLLQCMTQCIKQEGEDKYDTCKLRCANVPMEAPAARDCMADFKGCKKACGNNNECRKECKAALMSCG